MREGGECMACLQAEPCIVRGSWGESSLSSTGLTRGGAATALEPAPQNQCSFLETESGRLVSSSGTQYIVQSAAAWDASLARAEHGASEQAAHHENFLEAASSRRRVFFLSGDCRRPSPRTISASREGTPRQTTSVSVSVLTYVVTRLRTLRSQDSLSSQDEEGSGVHRRMRLLHNWLGYLFVG